jgi:hypothetical protein
LRAASCLHIGGDGDLNTKTSQEQAR